MIKQLCKLPPSYHKVRCSSVLLADEVKIVSNQKQLTNIYVDAFGAIRLIFFPSIILFALREKVSGRPFSSIITKPASCSLIK